MENELLNTVSEKLKSALGDVVLHAEMAYDFPVLEVKREKIHEVIQTLRDDKELGFGFLTTLCALHYPDNKGRELGMMYQLHNMVKNWRIRIKIFFPVNDPVVPTVSDLFASANWQERQEYDFYGVIFKGHPNLKRILNMDEMDYFPLRKEYAVEDGTRDDKRDDMFGR
jgi:NADH-quinone oxidoreductase subunit C